MDKKRAKVLESLGFDKEWLEDVINNFRPKSEGKYLIKIYDIENLDQNPEDGVYVDETCFDNDTELSIIHDFFEGNAYVLINNITKEAISSGIIDGAPFEEIDEVEGVPYGTWQWKCTKKKKIKVNVKEIISETITVEATNVDEAIDIVKEKYYNKDIAFTPQTPEVKYTVVI